MTRALLILAVALALPLATFGSTGASFSRTTPNAGNTYTAKADWVAPTVAMTNPGQYLRGTAVALGATASDGGSGVQSVTIQRSPAGTATWSTVCTTATSPYGCTLNTTAGATPDGQYDFRASATDNAANSATSTTVANRWIDNTAPGSVTIADPGSPLAGTASLSGTATDTGGSGVASLKFQYRPSSGGLWLDACTAATSPYSCSFDTSTLTDGLYDFQSIATDNAGNTTTSAVRTNRRVDNVAPTATMDDPGAYLRLTVPLTAAASDAGGIASVAIQRRPNSGGAWTTVCTTSVVTYTCSLDTAAGATPDGLYDFQAVATDNGGRSTTSSPVLARRIDNAAPTSVAVTNPGTPITGVKTLNGSATDGGSGLQTVELQYSPTGQNTWSPACSGTSSPAACSWTSSDAADGLYDFRTVATDRAGNSTASAATSPASRVDNNAPNVTMTDPVALRGTFNLGATASDGNGSGVANVVIAYKPSAGSTWTNVCTDNATPFTCSLNTTAGATPNGQYDFRATATDNVSKVTTSTVTSRWIDNAAPTSVTLTDPGPYISGVKSYSGAASDAHSGVAKIDIQYLNGSSVWTTVCTATVAPFSCSADSNLITDGSYSFRAVATDLAGNTATSTTIASRRIDNTNPVATMTDPGTNLRGIVTLNATAADTGGSGVASSTIQYKTSAGSTWIDVCTDNVTPYSCTLDVGPLAATDYDFRAVSTDNAGNVGTSTAVTNRRVDNYVKTLATASCGATTDTATVPAGGVAVGRTILLRVAFRAVPAGTVTASDSKGNVYTADANVNEGTARVMVFSAPVTTALVAGDTISVVHPSNPDSSGIVVGEMKNIVGAGRVDVVGTGTGNSSAPSVSATTTGPNEFLVGAIASSNNRTYTEASNWSLLSHLAQGCGGARGNEDNHAASRFGATAGLFSYAPTLSANANWAAALVAYKTN